MIKHPYDIEDSSVHLGKYKSWNIFISRARGEDNDTLSLHASNGLISFDSAFGKPVPCGKPFITPSEEEVKKELDDMRKRLDNYELSQMTRRTSFDPTEYIKKWSNK